MNAICTRNRIGITPSAANVAASTTPAEVITPPVTVRPRIDAGAGAAVPDGLLPHPRHEEDVVVDPERDEEHEPEQRHRRIRAREPEAVAEHDRGDAERRRVRQHDRADQQQRRDERPQQQREDQQDHREHDRDDRPQVLLRSEVRVEVERRGAADLRGRVTIAEPASGAARPPPGRRPSPPARRGSPRGAPARRPPLARPERRRRSLRARVHLRGRDVVVRLHRRRAPRSAEPLGRSRPRGCRCPRRSAARAPAAPTTDCDGDSSRSVCGTPLACSWVSPSGEHAEQQRAADPDHPRPRRDDGRRRPPHSRPRGRSATAARRRTAGPAARTRPARAARASRAAPSSAARKENATAIAETGPSPLFELRSENPRQSTAEDHGRRRRGDRLERSSPRGRERRPVVARRAQRLPVPRDEQQRVVGGRADGEDREDPAALPRDRHQARLAIA